MCQLAEVLRDLRAAATCIPEQMLSSLRTIEELVDLLLRNEGLARFPGDEHNTGAMLPKDCAQMIKVPTAYLTTLAHDFANFNKLLSGMVILEEAEFDLYNLVRILLLSCPRINCPAIRSTRHVCIWFHHLLVVKQQAQKPARRTSDLLPPKCR